VRYAWWDHGHGLLEPINSWDFQPIRRRMRELDIEITVRPKASSEQRFVIEASIALSTDMAVVLRVPRVRTRLGAVLRSGYRTRHTGPPQSTIPVRDLV
jgi:hypothetical protein